MASPSIVRFERMGELERWEDIPTSELESGNPVQRGHFSIKDDQHGVSAGVWDCTAFTSRLGPYPVNEFMIVLEGSVTIVEADGRETTVNPGESFLIPKGLVCKWKQPGYLRKYFVIFDDASGARPDDATRLHVIRPNPSVALAASTPPAADMLLSGSPAQHAHEYFADATGQWSVGVWDTTAYWRKRIPFPRHELMHILEGSVTLTDGDGIPHKFEAGETFFVPLGAVCDWRCEGYVRKIYCIFQPRALAAKTEAAE